MRHKLQQRIVTALILAGGLIASVVFLSLPGLALLFGGVVVIAAWAWSRLSGLSNTA